MNRTSINYEEAMANYYDNEHLFNMNDDIDREAEHENSVYRIINNGGYNLNSEGNEGRYVYSRIMTDIEVWDDVFDYLTLPPVAHNTSGYIYDHSYGRRQEDLRLEAFPLVDMIPLPSGTPGFRRCVFHIEEVINVGNRQDPQYQLTGRCFPVPVSYHVNHPIAQAIVRVFHFDDPQYQSNESTLLMTSYNDEWIRQLAALLAEPGNNREAFAQIIPGVIREPTINVFPDLELVQQANRTIVVPEYDDDPRGAQEVAYQQWRNIVYPPVTEEQHRAAYEAYAAEQINIHRRLRIKWAREYPNHPNPIELPLEDERENNPADRIPADNNPANSYIQRLYNAQNNDHRARIAAIDVRVREPQPALPALPVNRVLDLDG